MLRAILIFFALVLLALPLRRLLFAGSRWRYSLPGLAGLLFGWWASDLLQGRTALFGRLSGVLGIPGALLQFLYILLVAGAFILVARLVIQALSGEES